MNEKNSAVYKSSQIYVEKSYEVSVENRNHAFKPERERPWRSVLIEAVVKTCYLLVTFLFKCGYK